MQPMTRILSLETSTDRGGFALWSGSVSTDGVQTDLCECFVCPAGQPHAETLLPAVRTALTTLGWAMDTLDAITFDTGPGMFTGLRVSAAIAQGLAVALDKPLVPVSSLQVLAEAASEASGATHVLSLLDARMNQIYAGYWFREGGAWHSGGEACLVNPSALGALPYTVSAGMHIAGTALDEYPDAAAWCTARQLIDTQIRYPSPEALARLGAMGFVAGAAVDPAEALPVYVRDRVALTTAERAAGEVL